MSEGQAIKVLAIQDLAKCRLAEAGLTDPHVRHDLTEIVRISTELLEEAAAEEMP